MQIYFVSLSVYSEFYVIFAAVNKIISWIMMKRSNLWMLATILACGLLMASCIDEQIDNPSTTEPEKPSAKDPGKWWIDENNMDKSVNPGDNFFMYCNGSWWKNTTIPQGKIYVDQFTNVKPTFQDRIGSLDNPNLQTFLTHLKWADDGSEAAIAGQRLYDDVLAQSGLNEAKTKEDVLRAFGRMAAMGVCPGAWLEPMFIDGKVCLYAKYYLEEEMVEPVIDGLDLISPNSPSLLQMMQDDPSLQSHLVPLAGRSGTRAVPDDCLPLRYIVEGMGFDPKDVYFLDDYYKKKNVQNESIDYSVKRDKRDYNDTFSLTLSIEKLKKAVLHYYGLDYGFISQKTRAAYDEQYMKENELSPSETSKVGMKALVGVMALNYTSYMNAKVVADQMVPKSLKEEYLKYCEELRTVFAQRIKANEWMSEGSKKNALEKLEAMVFNVGYPDKWIEEALPDLSKSKSLIEDIYSFRKSRVNLLKAIIGKTRQEASFTVMLMNGLPLSKENAEYFSFYNAITIFPYYLLPTRYDPAQSLAINYAYLYVFGHEMTHGFDTNGSQYDKNGDYREGGIWASEADKTEFDRRAGLLVKWFGSLDVLPDEMPGVKAEGKVTLPENIADLGGMEIAWQVYQNRLKADGYTGQELKLMKQRFFQAFAEEYRSKYDKDFVDYFAFGKDNASGPETHSMNKERVNGVVANMDGWYDAFDIKEGALYRKPADRIRIW